MSLISLFPDLQEISRGLRHHYSTVKFSYSNTTIRLQARVDKPEYMQYAILLWLGITGVFSITAFTNEEYAFGVITALLGLGSAWNMYRTRNNPPNLKAVRLQNEILIDVLARQITVEHLHPYFRDYTAETTAVPFSEVLQVVACKGKVQPEGENYGQLYLVLADETRLYLIEVESERIARSLARVLQQVLGLPVDPEPKAWWQF